MSQADEHDYLLYYDSDLRALKLGADSIDEFVLKPLQKMASAARTTPGLLDDFIKDVQRAHDRVKELVENIEEGARAKANGKDWAGLGGASPKKKPRRPTERCRARLKPADEAWLRQALEGLEP